MELSTIVTQSNIYNATNAIYLNNQMLGEDKVDVVFAKAKFPGLFEAMKSVEDGTTMNVVGFIKDGDKGKKFLVTGVAKLDLNDPLVIRIKTQSSDAGYKEDLQAYLAEAKIAANKYSGTDMKNYHPTQGMRVLMNIIQKMSEV